MLFRSEFELDLIPNSVRTAAQISELRNFLFGLASALGKEVRLTRENLREDVLWRILPASTPRTRMPYWSLIGSLFGILGQYAELRRVAANQFFIGISYGGFWSTVAPMLLAFHALGPSEAGLMAIPGAAGVLISRAAGRWSDRSGASIVDRKSTRLNSSH